MMRLRATDLSDPVARALVLRAWTEICGRYGIPAPCGEASALPSGSFLPPVGTFLVGEVEGVAVACGGVRGCDGGPPGVAEIKRMYVEPSVRGRGLGRVLLEALEAEAGRLGYGRIWLETGTAQPEALQLYATSGWTPIPGYGEYRDEPDNRCFEKVVQLQPATAQVATGCAEDEVEDEVVGHGPAQSEGGRAR